EHDVTQAGQTRVTASRVVGTVRLMKPNYVRIAGWEEKQTGSGGWQKGALREVYASDGATFYHWEDSDNEYATAPARPNGDYLQLGFDLPIMTFFDPRTRAVRMARMQKATRSFSLRSLGTQTFDGALCSVIDFGGEQQVEGKPSDVDQRFYIGGDGLIHGVSISYRNTQQTSTTTCTLSNITTDAPMNAASFAYTPPSGAHQPAPPPPLLANGTRAPDFTVQDPHGNPIQLSDYKGKVVVIDFWATWCGPCQASLPGTNEVARQFKGKNVVVLAVNVSDSRQAFQDWLPKHRDYDALVFAIDTKSDGQYLNSLFHISGIPTQYVIDKNGKIVASFVGYNDSEKPLEDAIQSSAS
ncbi:MAG TPA: redoxin domain-containing protein, partial [Capsulimonadaceae bacterium]|nr:redoxin domain-containing protein [Capsulimonadaceae bacterium]